MDPQLSEALRKHLKIIAYLTASALLAYLIAMFADNPNYIYFAPVINYLMYAVEKELKDDNGVIKTLTK